MRKRKSVWRFWGPWLWFLVFPWTTVAQRPGMPAYLDPSLPVEVRVDDLLQRMTLQEKVSQMMSRTPRDLPSLGIAGYAWSGMSAHNIERGDACTIFPHAIAQASTWDPVLVQAIGTALSDEARALYHSGYPGMGLTFWAPVVELARDPRWGRTHECYGEDPLLTAAIAGAWVRGIQGDDPHYLKCIAAPKHFVANNEEWDRHNGSSDIDEALLRDYYLRPYEVLVRHDHAMGIMAAYNRLNGVPCIANRWLLTTVLREEWGFRGTVVTDCNGIEDLYRGHRYLPGPREAIAAAIHSGVDIECGNTFVPYLPELAEKNVVATPFIDSAVRRIMRSRFLLGLYDPPSQVPYTKIPLSVVDGPEHRELARQAAREAIILLRNEGSLLPLDTARLRRVAVLGPLADVALLGGYTGRYSHAVSPLEGLRNALGADKILYEKGTDVTIVLPPLPDTLLLPPEGYGEGHGLLGEYFSDTSFRGTPVVTRLDSTIDFDFGKKAPLPGMPGQYYAIRWTGRFVAPVTGDYYLGGDFDDIFRLWFDGKKVIDRSRNRNRSSAVVRVHLEKGRKYPLRLEFMQLWYKGRVTLGGGMPDPHRYDRAVALAREADVAIVVAGIDDRVEGEGRDRVFLHLPGDQQAFIEAVLEANPRTVLVLQNGGPVSLPSLHDRVPAIVETFCNGEEGGNALADVLLGRYNPAGRLPLTVYRSVDQLPGISDYDLRKGRTYLYYSRLARLHPEAPEPLWCFGHGLSYTHFSYGPLRVERRRVAPGDSVYVTVEVTNTGDYDGDEVVQLYARAPWGEEGPDRQLVAFRRVTVPRGRTVTVPLTFAVDELGHWDMQHHRRTVEKGEVILAVGSSACDIRGTIRIEVQ